MFQDDEDDDDLEALYEDGHWEWSDVANELVFISHLSECEDDFKTPKSTMRVPEFKHDIDIIEQQRFRKRYQRKISGADDVVLLQDVKDVVLYTAPSYILSPKLINVLHLHTTDRFIRALIFYIQYYIQVAEIMAQRMSELDSKVRTPKTLKIEIEYRENLEELRLLVAKEYSLMMIGAGDFKKFHHMGPDKKLHSLSKKEMLLFESFLVICIQIVWLALGRSCLEQIQLEIHRIFKSHIFNVIEHTTKSKYFSGMSPQERFVLLGYYQEKKLLNTWSPLLDTLFHPQPMDYRLLGFGCIKYDLLTARQRYYEQVLTAKETTFEKNSLTLGIVGLLRSRFDTMLTPVRGALASGSNSTMTSTSGRVRSSSRSRSRGSSIRKSVLGSESDQKHKIYPDIILPEKKYDVDLPPKPVEAIQISAKAPTGTVEFRDDVDLIEQIRFRRRYQRKIKPGQADVITVQDVKDIALYTAPVQILSPMLINMLHLPTTERFIRALTLYSAYYLQIADEMAMRIIAMETKVRTPDCEIVEHEYRDNLSDLRLLVAKEYSVMLIGGSDTKKFHHMGPAKKRRSLSDKDARLFETLLRMCVQIVWLALGRKSFNQIELEMNRMFKSEIFNAVEHNLKTGYITNMCKEERLVLLGHCLRYDKKLNTRSPLMNEVFCHRQIDYRMMGLGVIKKQQMSSRLNFMLEAIAGPEENLGVQGISLGILGMPRSAFDTMLKPLPTGGEGKSKSTMSSTSAYGSKSAGSLRKSTTQAQKLYPDVVLPPKESREIFFPPSFHDEPAEIKPCSETQRRRWQNRLLKLLHPHGI